VSTTRPGEISRTVTLALPAAVEFLTPLRLHGSGELPESAVGSSSAFFPLVGLLLGLALAGLDRLLAPILPAGPLNALLIAFLAAATGLLHLDGLADTADGLLGGHSREQRLAIMRDSRIGAFGAAALTLVLLMQWSALSTLVAPWRLPALLLFPVLGRAAMAVAIAAFPYARPKGLGTLFRRHIWPWAAPVALATSLLVAVLCFAGYGAVLWAVALLGTAGFGALLTSRLGGLTGDTYGAICELSQTLVLLLIVSAHLTNWLRPGLIGR
jgi:adenosylcobinamide-GDP ribazoletransferase